jgi:hypothetical protein
MLKIESGRSMLKARELIRKVMGEMEGEKMYKSVTISIDVDPQ